MIERCSSLDGLSFWGSKVSHFRGAIQLVGALLSTSLWYHHLGCLAFILPRWPHLRVDFLWTSCPLDFWGHPSSSPAGGRAHRCCLSTFQVLAWANLQHPTAKSLTSLCRSVDFPYPSEALLTGQLPLSGILHLAILLATPHLDLVLHLVSALEFLCHLLLPTVWCLASLFASPRLRNHGRLSVSLSLQCLFVGWILWWTSETHVLQESRGLRELGQQAVGQELSRTRGLEHLTGLHLSSCPTGSTWSSAARIWPALGSSHPIDPFIVQLGFWQEPILSATDSLRSGKLESSWRQRGRITPCSWIRSNGVSSAPLDFLPALCAGDAGRGRLRRHSFVFMPRGHQERQWNDPGCSPILHPRRCVGKCYAGWDRRGFGSIYSKKASCFSTCRFRWRRCPTLPMEAEVDVTLIDVLPEFADGLRTVDPSMPNWELVHTFHQEHPRDALVAAAAEFTSTWLWRTRWSRSAQWRRTRKQMRRFPILWVQLPTDLLLPQKERAKQRSPWSQRRRSRQWQVWQALWMA